MMKIMKSKRYFVNLQREIYSVSVHKDSYVKNVISIWLYEKNKKKSLKRFDAKMNILEFELKKMNSLLGIPFTPKVFGFLLIPHLLLSFFSTILVIICLVYMFLFLNFQSLYIVFSVFLVVCSWILFLFYFRLRVKHF